MRSARLFRIPNKHFSANSGSTTLGYNFDFPMPKDEIFDLIDERDRQIVRNAIEMIKRCAVEEAQREMETGND